MAIDCLETYITANAHNTPFVGEKLPEESFVTFDAFKLSGTELVWFNRSLLDEYGISGSDKVIETTFLKNYSYISKGYTDKKRIQIHDKKSFFADQYGSRHEVCNGGSARCGLNGLFQIKGIGRNPLIAQNISESHSHGKLFIDEAISEAIWGEICHRHLPYGAVRTLAIIKTNVMQEFGYLADTPKKHCALAIREISVRPAHFERCTFFWPADEYSFLRDNDAKRVRQAIPYLELVSRKLSDGIEGYLEALIQRLAEQIAVSRIKGIPHGSLTSSNISIDGRFLDFGTITAVPDFGNYVLANGVGAVWDDHNLIQSWLVNLAETVSHYSDNKLSTNQIKGLVTDFCALLSEYENRVLLNELGIKNISKKNLEKADNLKRKLCSDERKLITQFNDLEFRTEISNQARQLGLKVGELSFDLRKEKYSSFTMQQQHINTNYNRQSVGQLINSYL